MIGNRSLIENAEVLQTLAPFVYGATGDDDGDGSSVDTQGGTASMFQINIGTWTDGTHTIHFEESDDASTWNAIAAEDLDGYDIDNVQRLESGGQTLVIGDATKNGNSYMIAYIGGKRYLRARYVVTNFHSTGAGYGITVWKLGLRYSGRNPMRSNWDTANT